MFLNLWREKKNWHKTESSAQDPYDGTEREDIEILELFENYENKFWWVVVNELSG